MNNHSNKIFTALAEPTRQQIVEILAGHGQMTATAISKKFKATAPAISQHLKVLREASLVTVEKRGQLRLYQINPKSMSEIEHWAKHLADMWNKRFDRLEGVLEEEKNKVLNNFNNQLNRKGK